MKNRKKWNKFDRIKFRTKKVHNLVHFICFLDQFPIKTIKNSILILYLNILKYILGKIGGGVDVLIADLPLIDCK